MMRYIARLIAENLNFSYSKTPALRDLSFDLKANVIAVIGHNGSGKSTLIKVILGLLKPARGSVGIYPELGETRILPERGMAFCPEEGAVFEDISVEEYVKLWCRLKHGNSRYYLKEGSRYIELMRLGELLGRKGRELSKGQKRRVQIAVGYIIQPLLFLFDEPFDGLDVQQTGHLESVIQQEAHSTAYLLSSHRMEVVERLADIVLVLDQGRLRAAGSVAEVAQSLGGKSVVVSQIDERHIGALVEDLRQNFHAAAIHKVGSEIFLTGPELSTAAIRTFLSERFPGMSNYLVADTSPPLAEAMSCYLQNRNGESI